jgi:hypothetical protein
LALDLALADHTRRSGCKLGNHFHRWRRHRLWPVGHLPYSREPDAAKAPEAAAAGADAVIAFPPVPNATGSQTFDYYTATNSLVMPSR